MEVFVSILLLLTYLPDVGVGEGEHEQMHGPEAEALVVGGERHLQLLVIDEAAPVPVRRLETRHDARIRPWWERRRHQRRERAPVRRRCWISGRRGMAAQVLLVLAFFRRLPAPGVRLRRRAVAVGLRRRGVGRAAVGLRRRGVGVRRRLRAVAVWVTSHGGAR